jgi:hydrogenase maturation protein HypF
LVIEAAKRGEETVITGFGRFSLKERPTREGRNPATGAPLTIPASKSLGFKMSKPPSARRFRLDEGIGRRMPARSDGTLWGGEFLLADYRGFERLGAFKPVAMLGGAQAAHEPWRNLYAHLMAEMGWGEFSMNFAERELYGDLARRPRATLDAMARAGVNSPKASSCGRLFDAVAAALNICRERQAYEGEADARLEAIVGLDAMSRDDEESAYPFAIPNLRDTGLPYVEPLAMWRALLCDLILKTPAPLISARFHKGLARIVVAMTKKLARRDDDIGARFDTVALSGGCFQNRVLFEEIVRRLERDNFTVLSHAEVPANDGGLALGQAAIGAARLIDDEMKNRNADLTRE